MNLEEINQQIDKIIMLTSSKISYDKLSKEQKIIGALEILIGTATRSGVKLFFNESNDYLWQEALDGLKIVKAYKSEINYDFILKNRLKKRIAKVNFNQLQDSLVIEDFDTIYNGIRDYFLKSEESKKT